MFGVVFRLSSAVLGLTLLAWGNSIGDLVSDIAVAKQGFPRMAIAACFGGPLFSILLLDLSIFIFYIMLHDPSWTKMEPAYEYLL